MTTLSDADLDDVWSKGLRHVRDEHEREHALWGLKDYLPALIARERKSARDQALDEAIDALANKAEEEGEAPWDDEAAFSEAAEIARALKST